MRQEILHLLSNLHPSEAIQLVESIGKELRQKNSIRISNKIEYKHLDFDRPDLQTLKRNNGTSNRTN
jgi:hypothetical protein